jgi:hypothetical protein
MSIIGWLALTFLAVWVVWVVRKYRKEGDRITRMVTDFNREHPVREPSRDEL